MSAIILQRAVYVLPDTQVRCREFMPAFLIKAQNAHTNPRSLLDPRLLVHWKSLIEFQIELQHVDSGFSENSQLPAFGVFD
jgi:hypothetical protein